MVDQFFSVAQPPVAAFPHLITALDAELMGRVAHVTRSKPGLWHLPAPFDENDVFDPWRDAERTPFARWALPANQAELMGGGRWTNEAIFGTNAILLDAALDEAKMSTVALLRGARRDNGGFYQERFHDWSGLPQLLELTPWALMPVAADRSHAVFVTTTNHTAWLTALQDWCGRTGRTRWKVILDGDKAALEETCAPEGARERAASAQIDMFVARMERYFSLGNETLAARIQHRLEAGRQRSREVAKARQRKSAPRTAPREDDR